MAFSYLGNYASRRSIDSLSQLASLVFNPLYRPCEPKAHGSHKGQQRPGVESDDSTIFGADLLEKSDPTIKISGNNTSIDPR